MNKKRIDHPHRKAGFVTGAYSDGVLFNGFLFVSGQASIDFTTSRFISGTIEEETKRTLNNIKAIVEASGASLEDIVKVSVHLADIRDFDKFNMTYSEYFSGIKPARTTVQSVLAEGVKIEIDCIVMAPSK